MAAKGLEAAGVAPGCRNGQVFLEAKEDMPRYLAGPGNPINYVVGLENERRGRRLLPKSSAGKERVSDGRTWVSRFTKYLSARARPVSKPMNHFLARHPMEFP